MPMPKAMVATTTTGSPERNRAAAARFSSGASPAWNATAGNARPRSTPATRSVLSRLPQ